MIQTEQEPLQSIPKPNSEYKEEITMRKGTKIGASIAAAAITAVITRKIIKKRK